MTDQLIHARLIEAFREIEGVEKGGYNSAQKFKFRGIEDITAAVSPVFKKIGIVVAPTMRLLENVPQPDGKGYRAVVEATYTFYAEDGSSVCCTTIGEGVDSYDKATNKAMSAAFKYALIQTLCIGDPQDDSDSYSEPTESSQPRPVAASRPAGPAVDAESWKEWLDLREAILAVDGAKAEFVTWLDDNNVAVSRDMSVDLFGTMFTRATAIAAKYAPRAEQA